MYRKTPLASAVGCAIAASSLGITPLALAQDVDEVDEREIEEVIVVGSRIRKDVFTHASPIDVVLTENAAARGVPDIGELLRTTTVAAGSAQVTSATSTAFVQNGGQGVNTLSLRGLGANRTLTLLNGRRAGPAGTRGGVSAFDMNVLPLAAIERVEILKDGASSIYGSDAVAGVVNYITKKGDGATIDAYLMQPSDDGGEVSRISASWGKSFDRGNFRLTADYYKLEELAKGDRDYLACEEQLFFDPDTGARRDAIDPRTGSPRCQERPWGHVWIYDYQGPGGNVPTRAKAQYDYDGDLANFIPGFADPDPNDPFLMRTPPGWFPVAYDRASDGVYNLNHPFNAATTAIPETELATFYGEGELDLTDTMTVYAEALLNRRETTNNGYRQFWSYVYNYDYFAGNTLSAGWTGAQWLSPTPITDHSDDFIEVDYQRYLVGLRGDFTDRWSWDINYQYSKSDGSYTSDQIFDDSITDQNWLTGSCVGMTTSVRGVPCQDIPWLDENFLAGDVSPAMREFLFGVETGNTEYTQSSVEAYVTGDLFELPAGSMGAAFGVHYREDEIVDTPGPITLAGNGWGSSSAGITAGDDKTKAVFGELDVPLLADRPLFQNLTLNVSARWTDVESYGDDTTYKIGLNWQMTDTVRLRASQGTSFRTPALFELYLADETSFVSQRNIDPCRFWGDELAAGNISQRVADNCAATVDDQVPPQFPNGLPPDWPGGTVTAEVITGGGLGILEAETSKSNTVGIIWTPEFADLSISVDFFDIEVNDQVDLIGATAIVGGCYNSEFWPNDGLCNLFDRSGLNGGVDNVRDSYINVATQTNRGWDVALRYTTDLFAGTLSIDTQHTFQNEAITALFEDTVRDENGQFGEPEWVGRLDTRYDINDWAFNWGVQFVGTVNNEERFGGNTTTYRGETVRVVLDGDAVQYHDFSVSKFFDMGLTAVVGISNAFDEEPPRISSIGGADLNIMGRGAFYSQYDLWGRRFFVNLNMEFN